VVSRWNLGGYMDRIFLKPFFSILTPLEFQQQLWQSFGLKVESLFFSKILSRLGDFKKIPQ